MKHIKLKSLLTKHLIKERYNYAIDKLPKNVEKLPPSTRTAIEFLVNNKVTEEDAIWWLIRQSALSPDIKPEDFLLALSVLWHDGKMSPHELSQFERLVHTARKSKADQPFLDKTLGGAGNIGHDK